MFKNKTHRTRKINLSVLTAVMGISTLSTVAAMTSCSNSKTTSNSEVSDQAANGTDTVVSSDNGFSIYSKITFVAPDEPQGVTFSGSTIVKIKTGHMFGTVSHPTPILPGYTLGGWRIRGGEAIQSSTIVEEDITVEPIMLAIGTELSISGRQDLYDGIVLTRSGELQEKGDNGYTFDVIGTTTILPTDTVRLQEIPLDGGEEILNINHIDTEINTRFYIKPNFTEEELHTQIQASVYRGGSSDPLAQTALFDITVRPPYYYTESVTWLSGVKGGLTSLDLGKVYWTVYRAHEDVTTDTWLCATSDEMCYNFDETKEDGSIQYFGFYNGAKVDETNLMSKDGEGMLRTLLTDIYPGAEVGSIADFFLGFVTKYNPKLHGGIWQINSIGDGFLAGCTAFNQYISDLFSSEVVKPVVIGDYFMYGCTSFANGTGDGEGSENFIMPKASMIGDAFMNNCSSLKADIEIDPVTEWIGDNFMNDCELVKSLTVPSNSALCTGTNPYFGTNIMTNCNNLTSITFNTPDIYYLADVEETEDQRGSFTVQNDQVVAYTTGITVQATDSDVLAEILRLYPERLSEVVYAPYRHFTNIRP